MCINELVEKFLRGELPASALIDGEPHPIIEDIGVEQGPGRGTARDGIVELFGSVAEPRLHFVAELGGECQCG